MLSWTDNLALGNAEIDADHRAAVELMNRLANADDAAVQALFDEFIQHMRDHFARESAVMTACAFPPQACHEGEHTRVLGLLDDIAAEVAAGRPDAARHFGAEAGPAWFIDHRNTMDFVTVTYARNAATAG